MLRIVVRNLPAFAAIFLLSSEAFGYIDPGTGSMMIQWALGAALAAFAALNVYWVRIKAFFSGSSRQERSEAADESQQEANSNQ